MAGTQIGLKNIYVALITDEAAATYDTPKKISQAITANITPNFEIATLYADDQAVEIEETLGDIDVEIGIKDLNTEDYALLLGKTANSDGVVEDSVDDVAPYLALGFEIPLSGGGKRMYWYYKGKFQVPSSEHTTKQGATEFQTPTISGKFLAREDGKWRARVDSSPTNAAVVDAWFDAVYKPTVQTPSP